MFIVFDGIDGAGKSTQVNRLRDWLRQHDCDVECCADPGSTELGMRIRALLLDKHAIEISPTSEALLFMTARAQMVDEIIRPALEKGKVVICDRFVLSTIVYQGYAGDFDIESIRTLGQIATARLEPDLTLVLDLPVETALNRIGGDLDRMESRGRDYFLRVREGFVREIDRAPQKTKRIDATRTEDEIFATIKQHVVTQFPQLNVQS